MARVNATLNGTTRAATDPPVSTALVDYPLDVTTPIAQRLLWRGLHTVANVGANPTFTGKRGLHVVANVGANPTFTGKRGLHTVASVWQVRLSQLAREVLFAPHVNARVSQVAVEVLFAPPNIVTIVLGASGVLQLAADDALVPITPADGGPIQLAADAANFSQVFTPDSGQEQLAADNAPFWATWDASLSDGASLRLVGDAAAFWAYFDFQFTDGAAEQLAGDAPTVWGPVAPADGGPVDLAGDAPSVFGPVTPGDGGPIQLLGDSPATNPVVFADGGAEQLAGDAPIQDPFEFQPTAGVESLAGDNAAFWATWDLTLSDGGQEQLLGDDATLFTNWDQGTGVEIFASAAPIVPTFSNVMPSGVMRLASDNGTVFPDASPPIGGMNLVADAPPQVMIYTAATTGIVLELGDSPVEVYPLPTGGPGQMLINGHTATVPPPVTVKVSGVLQLAGDAPAVSLNQATSALLTLRGDAPALTGYQTPSSGMVLLRGDSPAFAEANFIPPSGILFLKSDRPVVTPLTQPSAGPPPGSPGQGVLAKLA